MPVLCPEVARVIAVKYIVDDLVEEIKQFEGTAEGGEDLVTIRLLVLLPHPEDRKSNDVF